MVAIILYLIAIFSDAIEHLTISRGTLDMQTHTTIVGVNGPIRLATPWRMAGQLDLTVAGTYLPRFTGSALKIGEPNLTQAEARVMIENSHAVFEVSSVTLEERSSLEFGIDVTGVGQFGSLDVTGTSHLDGTISLNVNENHGTYVDPTGIGEFDEFVLIAAASIDGTFANFIYDGVSMSAAFSSPSYYRGYLGDGLFRNLEYRATDVALVNSGSQRRPFSWRPAYRKRRSLVSVSSSTI